MTATTYVFAVAVEDRGHFVTATRLADRVIEEALPWSAGILDTLRRWGTGPAERPWHSVTKAYGLARERVFKVWGHFNGEPQASDAAMVRAQLLLFQADLADGAKIDAVVLGRDIDDAPSRVDGFHQALSLPWPFPVIAALCRPEVEAWQIAGFDPEDAAEHSRLAAERKRLGFSPAHDPHLLRSKNSDDPKDAKTVLERLCGADHERRKRCLEVPLAVLVTRGHKCGIADFIAAVRTELVPVLVTG